MAQITIQHLNFTYEGAYAPVFEDLDLQLDTNWKLGLVGRNGRGKTTLLRLLAGEVRGRGVLSCPERPLLFPQPVDDPSRTAREVLMAGVAPEEEWQLLRELNKLKVDEALLERPFASLSGGEQTRARLAALFLDQGGYPMLDEPTSHLDEVGRELVARYLRGLRRGFLLVSHDRAFLDGCVDHILALNPGGQELMRGDFSTWYREKEARDRRELARNEKLQGEIRRLEQAARQTAGWSDRVERSKYGGENSGLKVDRGYVGHKAAKMMKRSKAIQTRQEAAVEEKRGLLRDLERAPALKLPPQARQSGVLVELRDAAVCYGGRAVSRPCSLQLRQGERLALTGGNGCGKSSLLHLVLGQELEHTGTVFRASGLEVAWVSQGTDQLAGPLEDFARREGVDLTRLLTILRKLDFDRQLFETDMDRYSQGQKKKVLLAASLCRRAGLYLWDEPLNYVDLFSRIQLEDLILEHQPTMLFVEHDRAFREKIATGTVEIVRAEGGEETEA